MRKLTVKGNLIESVRVVAGESGPERYAGAELVKYLEKMGIPAGDSLTITVKLNEALGRDG